MSSESEGVPSRSESNTESIIVNKLQTATKQEVHAVNRTNIFKLEMKKGVGDLPKFRYCIISPFLHCD